MISLQPFDKNTVFPCALALVLAVAVWGAGGAAAQTLPSSAAAGPSAVPQSSYQGSVATGPVSPQPIGLSLDDAIARGLQTNLGIILSGTETAQEKAERLSQLQNLLPDVKFNGTEAVMQTDLAAEGLRITGFPKVVGPYGYTDLRAALSWSLIDVNSLRTYLAAKHNFNAAQLSAEDARQMVILTVGNAYMLVLADQAQVASVEAQVATAKVSLDQAVDNHNAGTAPLLDELRARVDYQTLEQQLIAARDSLEKDKLALARTIGLPLAQKFALTTPEPYALFDHLDEDALIKQAEASRRDLAALVEETAAATEQRKAATAERYPTVKFDGDYGVIGPTLGHSHGTGDATGTLSVPLFKEYELRGEAQIAQAQLDTDRAQLSDKRAQIEADVRDALLDIEAAQKQVEVAQSSQGLANEALKEAQERYANGVSDNLAVSEAQQSVAQADEQYVTSLYRDNIAKLSLARALGEAQNYKTYLGGK
ncbi:MAG TPA: TolC family protein [Terracidiphilus sp.]|nr:TolC family protein [Terracidiphilus sp.]